MNIFTNPHTALIEVMRDDQPEYSSESFYDPSILFPLFYNTLYSQTLFDQLNKAFEQLFMFLENSAKPQALCEKLRLFETQQTNPKFILHAHHNTVIAGLFIAHNPQDLSGSYAVDSPDKFKLLNSQYTSSFLQKPELYFAHIEQFFQTQSAVDYDLLKKMTSQLQDTVFLAGQRFNFQLNPQTKEIAILYPRIENHSQTIGQKLRLCLPPFFQNQLVQFLFEQSNGLFSKKSYNNYTIHFNHTNLTSLFQHFCFLQFAQSPLMISYCQQHILNNLSSQTQALISKKPKML